MASLLVPLVSKKNRPLQVLGVARISGKSQDELSLDDQQALYDSFLKQHVPEGFSLAMIASRGGGEWLDRAELRELERRVESGEIDLVIAEELGRIMRRHHAISFCELCEDEGVRLIALYDQIDTAVDDWRIKAGFASMRHEMYNQDTAKRIRRTQRNRFAGGGILMNMPYGLEKPEGATCDSQLRKAEGAQEIIEGMVARLEDGLSYAAVADWLTSIGAPLGPNCRSNKWTPCLVGQVIRNPIIKGDRIRNRRMSKRVNKTGRRKSVPAPAAELLVRHCPHLVFIEPARYDRLIAALNHRNAKYRRRLKDGEDPRKDVPRRKTRWPGQHLLCGICGRTMHYGAHGLKDHLICTGAEAYRCWNAISVDGPKAARLLLEAITAEVQKLPGFDDLLLEQFSREWRELETNYASRREKLLKSTSKIDGDLARLAHAISEAGHSETLLARLKELEQAKAELDLERQSLESAAHVARPLPNFELIRQTVLKALAAPEPENAEQAQLLRKLIPDLRVYPVRMCDGGHPLPQARFHFSVAPLLDRRLPADALPTLRSRELVVTLGEIPRRAEYLAEVVRLRVEGLTQREIGKQLGLAQAEVQNALKLHQRMQSEGLIDPLVSLTEPPSDYRKLCRHRHPRYRFEPLNRSSGEAA